MPIFDYWELIQIPENVRDGLNNPYIVFINSNNSETIGNLSTAEPTTNTETLYYVSPTNPADRISILEISASTSGHIYVSPQGNAVAYFVEDPGQAATGLYILDVATGLSGRILPVESLVQRGIISKPAWTPDGSQVAVVVETGYDLDIYAFDMATSTWNGLVQHPAYDFWPAWSPDGRYLAFVSDRAQCPSWAPGDPGACSPETTPSPTGGQVYVLDTISGQVSQLTDTWTTEAPYWINNRQLAFTGGDQFDLLNPSRSLWLATIPNMTAREVHLSDGGQTQFNVSESWSSDGSRVIFQSVNQTTAEIVVTLTDGTRLGTIDDLSFARFTMSADWSPDGTRLVIGGSGGQCPYGVRVLNEQLGFVSTGINPRSMCNPVFSPDGQYIAFTGFTSNTADGRVDVYSSSANGFDARNLTGDLRGQMTLLGWVGPQ
jgi:Tol biopolymer transport system component